MPSRQPPKRGEERLVKVVLSYRLLRDTDAVIERHPYQTSRSEVIRVALTQYVGAELAKSKAKS